MSQNSRISITDVVSLGLADDVTRLINKGYDPNQPDQHGNYPVTIAASRNDLVILKILVGAGANLDVFDGAGKSALGWATFHRNQDMINFINAKDRSDVNVSDQSSPRP